MEVCSPHRLPPRKRDWKLYVAVALGAAIVVLAAVVPVVLCQPAAGSKMAGNGSVVLARLEEELAVTNRSLAEARGQWDGCRKQLVGVGVLLGASGQRHGVPEPEPPAPSLCPCSGHAGGESLGAGAGAEQGHPAGR